MTTIEQKIRSLISGSVLDLGCGDKKMTRGFDSVVSVDVFPGAEPDLLLDIGKERLPFSDGQFDTVLMTDVIEHMTMREGRFALSEAQRVCGGKLVMFTPLVWSYNFENIKDPERTAYYKNLFNLHRSLWALKDFPPSNGWVAHEITDKHYLGVWHA